MNMKLKELVKINYGKDYKKLGEGSVPLFGSGGIFGFVDEKLCDAEVVLVPRKGSLNNIFYYNGPLWTVDTIFWLTSIKEDVNMKYLYYKLKSMNLASLNVGTAVPSLTTKLLYEININIPSYIEQVNIVSRVGLYDDKIENNNKIINTLEEISSLLYRRYFVDYEFPNDEDKPYKSNGGQFIDSELGPIPATWEVNSLGSKQLPLVGTGVKEFDNSKKYIATADVSETNLFHNYTDVNYLEKPSRANMQPIENSIWFAKMKDSRKLIRISTNNIDYYNNIILSTGFSGIKCDKLYFNYLWTFISSQRFDEMKNNLSNGTTMQAINNTNIKKIKLVLPSSEIVETFNNKVEPIFQLIENLQSENKILAETRDLLIQELIK